MEGDGNDCLHPSKSALDQPVLRHHVMLTTLSTDNRVSKFLRSRSGIARGSIERGNGLTSRPREAGDWT